MTSLAILVFLLSSGVLLANQVHPPKQFIKLCFGVSKAAYLPFSTRKFIQNGAIIENPSTQRPRFILGVIPFPPKYVSSEDRPACKIKGWTAKGFVKDETEVVMFKNDQQKLVVFGFRGTEATNLKDWSANFNLLPGRFHIGQSSVTVHKGFVVRYGYISSWFEREYMKIPQNYTIVMTGHSLGAAEATVAAVVAAGKLGRRPDAMVIFGSPYPGFRSFKTYYEKMVGCDRTARIEVKWDPVTRVSITVPGYTHVCDGVSIDGKTGINIIYAHSLYVGYENGIKDKYSSVNEINLGCDQML